MSVCTQSHQSMHFDGDVACGSMTPQEVGTISSWNNACDQKWVAVQGKSAKRFKWKD